MNETLLVVGSVAFDSIETRAGKKEELLGGAATYIGLAASHFCGVNMVAVVGEGDFPQKYIELFKEKKINLEGLEFAKGETFRWSGIYAKDFSSRKTLDTRLGVFEFFTPKIPQSYKSSKLVLLGNIHPMVQLDVLSKLSQDSFVITDTMNLWIETALPELKQVISKTDLLVINDEEAVLLTNELQINKAAQSILKMGPEYLIIKRGEHGAYLFNNSDVFFAPALPLLEVIDPTGAGDSFMGGLSGYLAGCELNFKSIKKSMIYGAAVASATCEDFGTAKTNSITRDEIDSRYEALRKMVCVD